MEKFQGASRLFLLLTACLTGALVMAVEVLGARIIAPFFGVSLFVWTALIAVTLLALSIGYVAGGRWADRTNSPVLLFQLIAVAGVLLLAVPFIKAAVLQGVQPLGLRWGALVGASVLFGPPLFLLGCVSPWLVRLAAREWDTLGRTVGLLYAISTAGSVAGTLAAGYYFVSAWGLERSFLVIGFMLLLLSASYFVIFRGRLLAALLPLLALGVAFVPAADKRAVLADGTVATVVDSRDSLYGRVQIVEYKGAGGHIREMLIDGLVQGGIDVANGQSVYEYPYLLEHLAVAANPSGKRCLVVGLGPGVLPQRLALRGIACDAVDIDSAVVSMARLHFGLLPEQQVYLQDARYFIATARAKYDFIVLDVFAGDTTPGHLLTREALTLVRERLAPGGVVAINLIGSLGAERRMTASVMHTLASVFPWVQVYPLFVPAAGEDSGNIAVLAGIGRPLGELPPLDMAGVHPMAREVLLRALAQQYVWQEQGEGLLLTDDYNPIDVLDLQLKEKVRKRILETTPAEILLSGNGSASAGRLA